MAQNIVKHKLSNALSRLFQLPEAQQIYANCHFLVRESMPDKTANDIHSL